MVCNIFGLTYAMIVWNSAYEQWDTRWHQAGLSFVKEISPFCIGPPNRPLKNCNTLPTFSCFAKGPQEKQFLKNFNN